MNLNLKTKVGRYTVSTVLLGFQFSDEERKLLDDVNEALGGRWETMVFDKDGSEVEGLGGRWQTEEEARVCHDEIVDKVKTLIEAGSLPE